MNYTKRKKIGWYIVYLARQTGWRCKIMRTPECRTNGMQRGIGTGNMREQKVILVHWDMKKEWGSELYIHSCSIDGRNVMA
jgi:hypothetical protein